MRQKLANLDEVIRALKSYLPQYLEEHEIDPAKNFCCLNPKHDDTNPSMSCKQDPENAFCFSCSSSMDIFLAAHWLENKPIEGPGFIEENVRYLAERFGVDIELEEMTEEEQYRYRTYRAYADAARLIANPTFGDYRRFKREIKRRGWKVAQASESLIGTVEYKAFREALKGIGYSAKFQDEIDLGRPDIFDTTNMIFTICDEWGRPVGFAARNLDWNGTGSKYVNQTTTGLKCNIYQKGRRLYNIHVAKKRIPPLFIFEGYTDVETAKQLGLMNCSGIGGVAFTQDHVELLKRLNCRDIILVLDRDDKGTGIEKTRNLIDNHLRGHRDLKISVVNLPNGSDPDSFLRENGLAEFLKLKQWDAFEWRLNAYDENATPTDICETMIPLIVNEASYITQDTMCGTLSQFTGIDKKTIKAELERLQNQKEENKTRERESIIEQYYAEIRRNPNEAKAILYEAANAIETVEEKYDETTMSKDGTLRFMFAQKEFEEGQTGEPAGFYLSETGLKGLQDALHGGDWRKDVFALIAGVANSGKCQSENTRVLLADGTYKRIADIVQDKDSNIINMAPDHKLTEGRAISWIDSGKLPCYRVATKDGIYTEPSETHPYYTLEGWKQVKDLRVGDRIAIARSYANHWRESKVSSEKVKHAELLGFFLSDGSITKSAGFSNIDKELIDKWKETILSLFPRTQFRPEKHNCTTYATGQKGHQNKVIQFLKDYKIWKLNSHEKFIPDFIFKLNKKTLAKFLGVFYACDGWVCNNKNQYEVGISLCNYEMSTQIRSLLLRYGIRARIYSSSTTYEENSQRFPRYTLTLKNIEDIRKFYNNIQIPLQYKQDRIKEILDAAHVSRQGYANNFPAELWNYIDAKLQETNMTKTALAKIINPTGQTIQFDASANRHKSQAAYQPRRTSNIPENILRTIGYILHDQYLISLADGDIYFDEIVSIEDIGLQQCYDLEVKGTHNFIANDTVVHNTGLCSQLAYEIASDERNNACVIYHTIDDSASQILPRLIVQAYGGHDLTLNEVRNPRYYVKRYGDESILTKREIGYNTLAQLVENGRIILKDVNDGASFAFGTSLIRYYQKLYPGRNIVYILDNLHKTPDYAQYEPRVRFKTLSNAVKNAATRMHACIIATAEYTKIPSGTVPQNNNLAETRALQFDANLICHIYNDLHETGSERALLVHEQRNKYTEMNELLPRIRFEVGKNKITAFKDRLFLDLYPESGVYRHVPQVQAIDDQKSRRRLLREQNQKPSQPGQHWNKKDE